MDTIDSVRIATELSLGGQRDESVDEATALRSFEAYFLGEMLRISAPNNPSGLFDGGQAGRMYREHFYQELARIIAENGGVGIATSLSGQLDQKTGSPIGSAAVKPQPEPAPPAKGVR